MLEADKESFEKMLRIALIRWLIGNGLAYITERTGTFARKLVFSP